MIMTKINKYALHDHKNNETHTQTRGLVALVFQTCDVVVMGFSVTFFGLIVDFVPTIPL